MHPTQLSNSAAKGRSYMCQVRGNPQHKFAADSSDLAEISVSRSWNLRNRMKDRAWNRSRCAPKRFAATLPRVVDREFVILYFRLSPIGLVPVRLGKSER